MLVAVSTIVGFVQSPNDRFWPLFAVAACASSRFISKRISALEIGDGGQVCLEGCLLTIRAIHQQLPAVA